MKDLGKKIKFLFLVIFNVIDVISSWYGRFNPEDPINRKPDDRKNDQMTEKARHRVYSPNGHSPIVDTPKSALSRPRYNKSRFPRLLRLPRPGVNFIKG